MATFYTIYNKGNQTEWLTADEAIKKARETVERLQRTVVVMSAQTEITPVKAPLVETQLYFSWDVNGLKKKAIAAPEVFEDDCDCDQCCGL